MKVRPETGADRAPIRAVATAAFPTRAEADLIDRLRADGDAAISLVAEADGAIVGHILFSPMTAPFRALGLAPLAVLPAHQREGIGGALIRAGLERAGEAGWQAVFVLGDPAYYTRFGFSVEDAAGFASPYAGPHLMALGLRGALPRATGAIAYTPAFAALES